MGGLLKYVSVVPDVGAFGATARAGVVSTSGGGVGYDAAAAINAPLADDKAALRVSGFYTHDGGFIDNLANGRDDVNESNVYGGRADLFVKPDRQAVAAPGRLRAGHRSRRHRLGGFRLGERRAHRRRSRPAASARRAVRAGVPAGQRHAHLRLRERCAHFHQQLSDRAQPRDHRRLRVLRAGARGRGIVLGSIEVEKENETDKFTQEVRLAATRHAAGLVDRRLLHRRGQRSVPDAQLVHAGRRRVSRESADRATAEQLRGVCGLRHADLARSRRSSTSPAGCATRTTRRRSSSRSARAR